MTLRRAGEAAEALLRKVEPGNCAATLEQLCAGSPSFEAGGDAVTLLGRQQQFVGGAPVSSFLLLRTRPASVLTAAQVRLTCEVLKQTNALATFRPVPTSSCRLCASALLHNTNNV